MLSKAQHRTLQAISQILNPSDCQHIFWVNSPQKSQTQTLKVWCIYLHLPPKLTQMLVNISYIQCLGK